jgi:hypothetical protein
MHLRVCLEKCHVLTFNNSRWWLLNSDSLSGSNWRKSQPPSHRVSADILERQKRLTNASITWNSGTQYLSNKLKQHKLRLCYIPIKEENHPWAMLFMSVTCLCMWKERSIVRRVPPGENCILHLLFLLLNNAVPLFWFFLSNFHFPSSYHICVLHYTSMAHGLSTILLH